jgi:hypothetical protein
LKQLVLVQKLHGLATSFECYALHLQRLKSKNPSAKQLSNFQTAYQSHATSLRGLERMVKAGYLDSNAISDDKTIQLVQNRLTQADTAGSGSESKQNTKESSNDRLCTLEHEEVNKTLQYFQCELGMLHLRAQQHAE